MKFPKLPSLEACLQWVSRDKEDLFNDIKDLLSKKLKAGLKSLYVSHYT